MNADAQLCDTIAESSIGADSMSRFKAAFISESDGKGAKELLSKSSPCLRLDLSAR